MGRGSPALGTYPCPMPTELGCSSLWRLHRWRSARHICTPSHPPPFTTTHHLLIINTPHPPFLSTYIYPSIDLAICPCIYPIHQLSIHPLPCLPICPTHTSTWPPLLTYLSTLHPLTYSPTHLPTSQTHTHPSIYLIHSTSTYLLLIHLTTHYSSISSIPVHPSIDSSCTLCLPTHSCIHL